MLKSGISVRFEPVQLYKGAATAVVKSGGFGSDLFDMLLPMLGIYQEYVRNHHYSLQVLAEYKQKEEFTRVLKRWEEKPQCDGRSIESFLTFPMYQVS
ncbi:unnamed protein product [Dibothriocephalus latus]|uniref:DH domain-containing protein n=1 Tax=Dibothriocephalus latus TaxID=60516 RepID=A0A3P6V6E6_DIBLA|nr:unnamed protein product [Dibothriocephalus latus]